jgi:hypothetical protein
MNNLTDNGNKIPYPIDTELSDEEINKRYNYVLHNLSPNPIYHFRISIPKDWDIMKDNYVKPGELSTKILSSAGLFKKTMPHPAEIEIGIILLSRDISPGDWLEVFIKNMGWTILKIRSFNTAYGRFCDILYRLPDKKRRDFLIARSVAVKDGERLFVVICRCREKDYPLFADDFYMAISSFEIVNSTHKHCAEEVSEYEIKEPLRLRLRYFSSWKKDVDTFLDREVFTINFKNFIDNLSWGQITFSVIRRSAKPDMHSVAKMILEMYGDEGINIRLMDERNIASEQNLQGMFWTYEAKKGDFLGEIKLVILSHPKAWIVISLLTIHQEVERGIYAINLRAFQYLISRFEILE